MIKKRVFCIVRSNRVYCYSPTNWIFFYTVSLISACFSKTEFCPSAHVPFPRLSLYCRESERHGASFVLFRLNVNLFTHKHCPFSQCLKGYMEGSKIPSALWVLPTEHFKFSFSRRYPWLYCKLNAICPNWWKYLSIRYVHPSTSACVSVCPLFCHSCVSMSGCRVSTVTHPTVVILSCQDSYKMLHLK